MNTTAVPPAKGSRRIRRAVRACGRVLGHTAQSAWNHSIFSKAATAAFWQTLSLPPLLLGLLGSLGYVGGWFGPDIPDIIVSKIVTFTRTAFSDSVVDEIIAPTVYDVLNRGRADVMSLGFILSLWAARRRSRRSSIRSSKHTANRITATRSGSACSAFCCT